MANKFEIRIQAIDAFTNVFRKLNDSASKAVRPAIVAQRQFAALGKEMHLDKLAAGFRSLSSATFKVAGNLGLAAGPMESIIGLGTIGGIVGVTGAVAALGATWGRLGFNIDQTSTAIGVSRRDLQLFRGAANLAGVSTETADAALQGLGKTMQDATNNRNSTAANVLKAYGVSMKTMANGAPDVINAMNQVADAMARMQNPYVRQLFAGSIGIPDAAIPMLMKGSAAMEGYRREVEKIGIATDEQIGKSVEFEGALFRLRKAWDALTMTVGAGAAPALATSMNAINRRIQGKQDWSFGDFFSRMAIGADWMSPGGGVKLTSGAQGRLSRIGSGSVTEPGIAGNAVSRFGAGIRGLGFVGDGTDYRPGSAQDQARTSESVRIMQDELSRESNPANRASLGREIARMQGGTGGAGSEPQRVQVEAHVRFSNAPPGTRAEVKSSSGTWTPAKVTYAMDGAQ